MHGCVSITFFPQCDLSEVTPGLIFCFWARPRVPPRNTHFAFHLNGCSLNLCETFSAFIAVNVCFESDIRRDPSSFPSAPFAVFWSPLRADYESTWLKTLAKAPHQFSVCFFHRHVFSPIVSFAVDQKMNFCWCLCFCSGALGSCFDAVSQMKYNSLCARVKSVCLPRYNCCKDCTTAAISQLNINDARVSSMSNDTYVQPLC